MSLLFLWVCVHTVVFVTCKKSVSPSHSSKIEFEALHGHLLLFIDMAQCICHVRYDRHSSPVTRDRQLTVLMHGSRKNAQKTSNILSIKLHIFKSRATTWPALLLCRQDESMSNRVDHQIHQQIAQSEPTQTKPSRLFGAVRLSRFDFLRGFKDDADYITSFLWDSVVFQTRHWPELSLGFAYTPSASMQKMLSAVDWIFQSPLRLSLQSDCQVVFECRSSSPEEMQVERLLY